MDTLSHQQPDIYLISDTHFDEPWFSCHRGLGRHCTYSEFKDCWKKEYRKYSRPCPFNHLDEMNKILIDNWNKTVRKDDTVYFIGDWHDDEDKKDGKEEDRQYWQRQLNGKILSIKGNHDEQACVSIYRPKRILETARCQYLLVHDPHHQKYWKGKPWKGWVIHGHYHNNDLYKYPFINGYNKTINVSVEVIGYKPISIDLIEALHLSTIRVMKTIDSTPT
jgi:calcineurin-like phosphoesterase family protein